MKRFLYGSWFWQLEGPNGLSLSFWCWLLFTWLWKRNSVGSLFHSSQLESWRRHRSSHFIFHKPQCTLSLCLSVLQIRRWGPSRGFMNCQSWEVCAVGRVPRQSSTCQLPLMQHSMFHHRKQVSSHRDGGLSWPLVFLHTFDGLVKYKR